jgi:hypothetical protein
MPISMSLGQIMQPAQQAVEAPAQQAMATQEQAMRQGQQLGQAYSQGMSQSMQLAQTQKDVELKKQELEVNRQKLDDMKWTSFKTRASLAVSAPAKVRGKLFDQLGGWMTKQGMDPTISDALKDEDFQADFIKAMQYESKNPTDAAGGLQSLNALSNFMPAVAGYVEKHMSMKEASDNKQASLANARVIAEGHDRTGLEKQDMMNQQKQSMMEDRVHSQVMARIDKDPTIGKQLTQYNNLGNALTIITKANNLTPESIHEFQQSIRSNLGIKSGSGVGEREQTYLDSLGLHGARWKEFLTGDPADLAKDSAMMTHLKDMANQEQSNIQTNFKKRLNSVSSGFGHIYGNRPDLKMGLEDKIGANIDQLSNDAPAPSGPVKTARPVSKGAYDFSKVDQTKLKAAQDAGYSDDEIATHLGVKPTGK